MIAIIDYNAGNLRSVYNSFEAIGHEPFIATNPKQLKDASGIVLPGVGAFGDGIKALQRLNFIDALNEEVLIKKKPYLGICLGLQFVASKSLELGTHTGFGWINGDVQLIKPDSEKYRIPHIGWNNIQICKKQPLYEGLDDEPVFYFVHSYHFVPKENQSNIVSATCWHGTQITASIQQDHIFGIQFHPEKSQKDGLALLKNYTQMI